MGLKSFIEKITKGITPEPFDTSIFNDPLADKTPWTPQARGGASFKTRSLKKVSSSELHYKGSTGGLLFALIFAIMPLIIIIGFFGSGFFEVNGESKFVLIFFLIFPVVGFYLLYRHFQPIVLDKRSGYFYKGFKKPVNSLQRTTKKNQIKLKTVAALQIISEYVKTDKSSYTSYELNFVFEDGSRYNVIDHAKYEAVREDAVVISEFLGVPFWDGVSRESYIPKNKKSMIDTDAPYDSTKRRFRDM